MHTTGLSIYAETDRTSDNISQPQEGRYIYSPTIEVEQVGKTTPGSKGVSIKLGSKSSIMCNIN